MAEQIMQYFEGIIQINNMANVINMCVTVLSAFVFGVLIYFTYKNNM